MTADLMAVQAEMLLPHEIEAALAARAVVYLPLGSVEFHSAHLPIGLDGLNAHSVCSRLRGQRRRAVHRPLRR
jgi:creatinine amidohydrolase